MAGFPEEMAGRLLDGAGVAVTAVDLEPASDNVPELGSATATATATARVGLATAAGDRHLPGER